MTWNDVDYNVIYYVIQPRNMFFSKKTNDEFLSEQEYSWPLI